MKKEWNILLNALMYYSRIPVPKNLDCTEETLSKAFRYFPLVGIVVGSIGAGCLLLADSVAPVSISVLCVIAVMILLTGAIHEDGLADFFDGFGGGTSKESILRIMKDSHIGTYGVIALIMMLALRFITLTEIPLTKLPFVLIAASAASRVFPILLVKSSSYARQGQSKAQHTRNGIDTLSFVIAIMSGVLPSLLLNYRFVLLYFLFSGLFFMAYRHYLHRKIGGFTGDTLGALQQFTELFFYLLFIIIS